MTIRFLAHGAERTGPPIYLLRLLRWWSEHRPDRRTEVVLARPGELLDQFAAVSSVSVARLDSRSPERLLQRAATVAGMPGTGTRLTETATRVRVGRGQPDVTVVNGATSPTVQLLRALRPQGQVITIAHELATGWRSNLSRSERQFLLSRTDRYLAVSEAVQRYLVNELGVRSECVTQVPPVIDVKEFPPEAAHTAGSPPIIAGSGVTDWRKAPEIWLRVAAEVKERCAPDPVRFVWFGGDRPDAPNFWPLEHDMAHLGLGGEVSFLGHVADPATHLLRSTVFVSTAREDAYPLACAESIALGVPVVGFDGEGVAEMVRDSGCGVVVPFPRTDLMADHVADLLRDPARRSALGEDGREFGRTTLDVSVIGPAVVAWIEESLR